MRVRTRPDRCPGVLRPWPAADGALARIRVPGGQVRTAALLGLLDIAREYGDGQVRLTGRANLQLRALPGPDVLPEAVVRAVEATGLLPSRAHDLARNVLVSPQTGRAGGRADLRGVVAALDAAIVATPRLADLPGRFLFTLDDGRGDLADRHRDLGLVAVDDGRAQLRIGPAWGPAVELAEAADALVALAEAFLDARGDGPQAAWHVDELGDVSLAPAQPPLPGVEASAPPLAYGAVPGGVHEPAGPDGVLDPERVAAWATHHDLVVLTPFGGVFVPEESA